VANHRDRSPAVVGAGWDVTATGADPASSQLLESRARGDVEVARVFGIVPAELLLVAVDGSSVTYQNIAGMLDTLVRVTVAPAYLAPIEEALGDLLPRTQVVRFSLTELERLAEAERIPAEVAAIDAGIYTLPEVRASRGLPTSSSPQIPPALLPSRPSSAPIRASEVPAQ
jgi:phage portal protein BeeE